jgi:hypothetical protein
MINADVLIRHYSLDNDMVKVVVFEPKTGLSAWITSSDQEKAEKMAIDRFKVECLNLKSEKQITIQIEN